MNRLKKVRAQYPGHDIRVIDFWPVPDMGKYEASVHQMFSGKKDGEWFTLNGGDIETLSRTLKGPNDSPHKVQKLEAKSYNSEPSGSGAASPADPRQQLWSEGLSAIQAMTGKTDGAARKIVGRWCKLTQDDCAIILSKIRTEIGRSSCRERV